MTNLHRLATAAFVAALTVVACGSSSGSPSPTPSSTPDPGTIDHPTGADEIVLRLEEGGGLVPMEFFATAAPSFTLYGDGTVLFHDPTWQPPAGAGSVIPARPFLIARLDEGQIQELLAFALGPGGLAVAKPHYDPGNLADAPTATFTITAGGTTKTVSVTGLGFEWPAGPDAAVAAALARLGERIRDFGPQVSGEEPWLPERYRAMLTGDAFGETIAWPWPDLGPDDFTLPVDPQQFPRFPSRVMTPAEVEAAGYAPIGGGYMNLGLLGPDGKTFSFAVRPLLPDETR